jgi:hypothetical protein
MPVKYWSPTSSADYLDVGKIVARFEDDLGINSNAF